MLTAEAACMVMIDLLPQAAVAWRQWQTYVKVVKTVKAREQAIRISV